jgi:hypothetical protein
LVSDLAGSTMIKALIKMAPIKSNSRVKRNLFDMGKIFLMIKTIPGCLDPKQCTNKNVKLF